MTEEQPTASPMSIQFSLTHNKPLANVSPATSFGNKTQQSSATTQQQGNWKLSV